MSTRHYNAGASDALRQYGVKTANAEPALMDALKQDFRRNMTADVNRPVPSWNEPLSAALHGGWSAYDAPEGESRALHGVLGGTGGMLGGAAGQLIGRGVGGTIASAFGFDPTTAQYIGRNLGGLVGSLEGMNAGQSTASKIDKHFKKPAKGTKDKSDD